MFEVCHICNDLLAIFICDFVFCSDDGTSAYSCLNIYFYTNLPISPSKTSVFLIVVFMSSPI